MPSFTANDGVILHYSTFGSESNPPLILLHGFTGSGEVFKRNTPALSQRHFVLVPDLRGHGASDKPKAGYHVARLAMDLKNFIDHMRLEERGSSGVVDAIGASLGAAILWSYAELFTPQIFAHLIFVDQAPLQNYLSDWGPAFGNRGMNDATALASLQQTLATDPVAAHRGTIASCLGYRSHPVAGDPGPESEEWKADEAFFLGEALKGDAWWYGKLMADHTANDWRSSIKFNFGDESGSKVRVLVVASERSGCFPAEGPMHVVELVNGGQGGSRAKGVVVGWGGHWCYWEKPEEFHRLVEGFFGE